MPGLRCQAADCVYNLGRSCSAHTIRVSRTPDTTYCDTYAQDSPMVTTEKQRLFQDMRVEFSTDIGAPKIVCTASECAYNKAFHCRAGRVDIDDAHDAVLCSCLTYRPK